MGISATVFEGKGKSSASAPIPQVTQRKPRKRDAARKLLVSGICPSQPVKAEKAAGGVDPRSFIATAWHTSCLKLWSEGHADKILTCLKCCVFPDIGVMDICRGSKPVIWRSLLNPLTIKALHDVAGRVKQHLTKNHTMVAGRVNKSRLRSGWRVVTCCDPTSPPPLPETPAAGAAGEGQWLQGAAS